MSFGDPINNKLYQSYIFCISRWSGLKPYMDFSFPFLTNNLMDQHQMSLFNSNLNNQILSPNIEQLTIKPETPQEELHCQQASRLVNVDWQYQVGFKFSNQYPTRRALNRLFVHYQGLQDIEVCNMN